MNRTRASELRALAPLLLAGCADDSAPKLTPAEDWATEAEYEIGDRIQDDAFFGPHLTVPESFQPLDVTASHVWGIRRDELDVGYVTGLRLVPRQ